MRQDTRETLDFLDHTIHLQRLGCDGDEQKAKDLIQQYDGKVDVIAIEGIPGQLQLAETQTSSLYKLKNISQHTPVVDGTDIRDALERWSLHLMGQLQPGLFNQKHVLFLPGLNYSSALHSIKHLTKSIRIADPCLYFKAMPVFLATNKLITRMLAPVFLHALKNCNPALLRQPQALSGSRSMQKLLRWADIVIGDITTILDIAPKWLKNKTIVVEYADESHLELLKKKDITQIFTIMPPLVKGRDVGHLSIAALNAILYATAPAGNKSQNRLVNQLTKYEWQPGRRIYQDEAITNNRFAFVIHPLDIKGINSHPLFRWTRFFPNSLVEFIAAYMPPLYIARITGGQSPLSGQKIIGDIYAVVATPRQMMLHKPELVYKRIKWITRLAERKGARIIGLGAFTSVVGDAGYTIAHESNIAVTSGNSLTAATAIDALKLAAHKMGMENINQCKLMVLGATGSIGAVCARWLAEEVSELVLVSRKPEKLLQLKRKIEQETPQANVSMTMVCEDVLPECDLVISATSAFGQRVLDISQCKPGAVICDVARPHDINPKEAALRPDVLVIDGGEVRIPGEIRIGYDIGLPPGIVYACMGETALLAMAGRFEDFTLGRQLDLNKVKEIHELFMQHEFKLSELHSFGHAVTDVQIMEKRELAQKLRQDVNLFHDTRDKAQTAIAKMPPSAKGVTASASAPGWLLYMGRELITIIAKPFELLLRKTLH